MIAINEDCGDRAPRQRGRCDRKVPHLENSAQLNAPVPLPDARPDVLVIGAGFAGLAALAQLRDRGFEVIGVERGPDVGGTWYWNRYPGLRCDVESQQYSYSWDPSLEQEWTWRERYASQPEILSYARWVADRLRLRPLIHFNREVIAMSFSEVADRWDVLFADGSRVEPRWVILATGALSTPKSLDIPGVDTFLGEIYRTSDWPEVEIDFTGERVAVVGTGSSGIQVATELARQASHLTVLQRTASFSLPAGNRPLTHTEVQTRRRHAAELREAERRSMDGLNLPTTGLNATDVDAAVRSARFEEAYAAGIPFTYFGIFNDILESDEANGYVHEFLSSKIRERVSDPRIAEMLVPRGYPFGTKRACLDSGYYEIFNEPHVDLIDLTEHPISSLTPSGMLIGDTPFSFDAIVFATGYDAFTGTATRIDIRGTETTLAESWAGGAHAHLGLMIPTFPNLFLVTGPQSPAVLSNMMVSIEQHVEWIVAALEHLRRDSVVRFEATRAAEREWLEHAAELGRITVYRNANSWYVGGNIAGKPRTILPYLGGVGPFRERCEQIAHDGYPGFLAVSAASGRQLA